MTIIEQIKAEIERRKMESIGFRNNEKREDWASFFNGEATALENLLSFLSTLESEKPMNLEDEINRYLREECSDDDEPSISDIARHFAQWGAEHLASVGKTLEIKPGDEVTINGHKIVYDKDKGYVTIVKSEESVPNDLEEAARHSEILTYPMPEDGDIEKVFKVQEARVFHEIGFIAGAKWQKEQDEKEQADLFTIVALDAAQRAKEQMMKDAVAVEVVGDKRDLRLIDSTQRCLFDANRGDWLKIIIVKE